MEEPLELEIDIREYLDILKRGWWLILLAALLAGGAAYFFSAQQPPVYRASGKLFILQAPVTGGSGGTADYAAIAASERLAQTYAELIKTQPVMERVAQNLGLSMTPSQLAGRIHASPVQETSLIEVSVQDYDPQRAADIANEVMRVFILQNQALQASRYAASKENLQRELAAIQAEMEKTRAQLDALGNPSTPEGLAERQRLEALLAQYRSSYATLLRSYEDVRLAEARTTDNVYIAEAATPNFTPVAPRTKLNTLLATFLGALLAIAAIFAKEALDDSVKSGEQATAITKVPVIGSVGIIKGRHRANKLIAAYNPRSPLAESFRILRTNIEFAEVNAPVRTLVVTSSGPQEGKSTVAANLAIVLAQAGRRVLLVDADLRRPTVHHFFRKANTRGLTTALLQPRRPVTAHIVESGVRGLSLMTSGPVPPNPAELLGSKRMKELLEALQNHAQIIVLDSPPVLALADTHLLARMCDATLIVVDVGKTKMQALKAAVEQLHQYDVRVLGLTLNRVSKRRTVYYLQYEYTSHYAADTGRGWLPWRNRHKKQGEPVAEG